MPIPRFTDKDSNAYEQIKFCQDCAYAIEDSAVTRNIKNCPECGKKLVQRRVNYGPRR